MIKSEMKGLKEYRKLFKRDSVEKRKANEISVSRLWACFVYMYLQNKVKMH